MRQFLLFKVTFTEFYQTSFLDYKHTEWIIKEIQILMIRQDFSELYSTC